MSNERGKVPVQEVITLVGTMAGQQVTMMKDEGCNTKVVSLSFVNKTSQFLKIKRNSAEINHLNRKTTKYASEVVIDPQLKLQHRTYPLN